MARPLIYIFLSAWMIAGAAAQQRPLASPDDLLLQLQKSDEDTSRVHLLLQLSDFYFSNPNADDKGSSLLHARAAEALSNRLRYQKGLGNSYEQLSKILHHRTNDTAGGKDFAYKAIQIFKTNNYLAELGYAYYDLSGYYSLSGDEISERIRCVEQSLLAFQKSGDKKKEADVFKELGDLRQIKGDYIEALSDLKQALKIFQSIGYPALQGTYDLMGNISVNLGDYESALSYGLSAVSTAEQLKDTSLETATIYNRVGITYNRLKKYKQACEYWEKGLLIAQRWSDTATIVIMTANLARGLVELNKPSEALTILQKLSARYRTKDDYLQMLVTSRFLNVCRVLRHHEAAQQYCDKLLHISQRFDPNYPDQSLVYEEVIPFYLDTRQYALARRYLAIHKTFCQAVLWPLGRSRNHLWWFKLDSTLGNYQSAILHYQSFKAIEDSLLNETTRKKIEQLQIQYQSDKKDQDIVLLENQSRLQQGKLVQASQARNWISGIVLLLLIIVALLINNSRVKQHTNKKLKLQQKEIERKNLSLQHLVVEKDWLVKEIHHRVKNNFHTVMGLLGTQCGYLKNEEAIKAITVSQHRVHAMSLIHQKLYQSDNLSAINMPAYIHELVDYLRDSLDSSKMIGFKLEIEPLELDLSHCIPLGLILNEAITNSIKYAFPGNGEGTIYISLAYTSDEHLLLIIQDNGVGLPGTFDIHTKGSMGMNLMQGLSEDIGGEFSISNQNGTIIHIDFDYTPELTPSLTSTHKATYPA